MLTFSKVIKDELCAENHHHHLRGGSEALKKKYVLYIHENDETDRSLRKFASPKLYGQQNKTTVSFIIELYIYLPNGVKVCCLDTNRN